MAEKSLSEVAPHCREQFEKGMAAFDRQNYDYAIDIFCGLLQLEPGFYEAREALRATQFKRVKADRGFLSKIIGRASLSPTLAKAQMLAKRKPLDALVAAELVLNADPGNGAAHRALAEAAVAAGLPKTALLSLEIAFKQNPSDRKLALLLANSCADAGQIGRAESIYAEVIKANPDDPDLQQAAKNLSARRTMAEGGYDSLAQGKGSFRDVLRDQAQSVALEQQNRVVKGEDVTKALIEKLTAQLNQNPNDPKSLRALAEACEQVKDFEQAVACWRRLKALDGGGDPALDKAITQAALKQFDQQLEGLDADASDHDSRRQALLAERQTFEIRAAKELVDRYPSDLQLRFELGQIYFRAGKIGEAIGEFQKSQASPQRRGASLGYLGQCFSRRGLHDVGLRTLQRAIDEKTVLDEEKMELIYQLGLTLELMGRRNEAIEQFKQIYEVNIGFRDVAARVDAYYANQTQ